MGIKCGIVGLPNVGKSTLFNALTGAEASPAENYPFCTIDPNVGVVTVPDPQARRDRRDRRNRRARADPSSSSSTSRASSKARRKGQGLGNQFLAQHPRDRTRSRTSCAASMNDDITHVAGKIDPLHDIEIIDTELMLADLDAVQKVYQRAEKRREGRTRRRAVARRDALKKLLDALENGKPARTVVLGEGEAERAERSCT